MTENRPDDRAIAVLLVEDNPGDARLLQEYLSEADLLDAAPERAATLEAALDRLRDGTRRPDVVLLDLGLPDATGLEAVEAVVATAPELPVVVLTGRDDRRTAVEALREGAEDFLLKGEAGPDVLARSIRYALERKRAARELEAERARLAEVFEVAPAFIAILRDPDHVFEMVNPAYRELAGDRDYIGRPVRDVFPELDDQQFFDFLDGVYHTGESYHAKEAPVDLDLEGSTERRYLNFVYQPRRGEEGEVVGVIAHGVDVTEEVRARRVAKRAGQRYRTLFSESPVGIAVVSEEGRPVEVNETLVEMLGREPEELKNLHFTKLTHPDDRERDVELYQQLIEGEIEDYQMEKRFLAPDGEVVWGDLRVASVNFPEQDFSGQVAFVRDVTDRKRMEEELRYRALHDSLTELPNRTLFADRLELALARSQLHGHLVGLLMLDVDRFKQVNDQYGHAVGDRLLGEVAERLQSTLRGQDTAARLGGDEFGVLLVDLERSENLTDVRTRLMRALGEPYQLGGDQVELDVTVGGVLHSDDEIDGTVTVERPDDLLRYADLALHRAKETRGSSFHLNRPKEDSKAGRAFAREQELRRAIREEEFELRWQPIVRLEDGSVQAVEPLARWRHPKHGMLSPGSFIPLAEETGLIPELGKLLFRQVCREAANGPEGNGPSVRLTPNLSGEQFDETDLPSVLKEIANEAGLEPDRFWLEITETEVLRASEAVETLRDLGFGVFVDDFGTGRSSFHYLRDHRFEGLKIDMSFVHRLGHGGRGEALVETMITMGRTMEMRVVAEGIETEEQRDKLIDLGCELGQGFLFARPMSMEDLRKWMEERS